MQVTERRIDKHGQAMLFPEVEAEGWWTSLEQADAAIIGLYRDHATSEQFHSEFKTDLDVDGCRQENLTPMIWCWLVPLLPITGELKQTTPKSHRILRKPIASKA
jgi:hypothetical protein